VTQITSCLYRGEVVHRRLAPVRHNLRYRVYNLFLDIDDLPQLSRKLWLFSYNRFNLFSISDHKHGRGDGTSIRDTVWEHVNSSDVGPEVSKVFMFCYPRVLGYVFNPLTVYYGFNTAGELRLMIFEVNNTFGDRHTYVLPFVGDAHLSCTKKLYVSPFNDLEGHYDFTVHVPGDQLKLTIVLTTQHKPCLSAWFDGTRLALTDGALLRSFVGLPFLPLKIVAGIHWEAARLWFKGLRMVPRPAPPDHPVSMKKLSEKTR